MDDLVPKITFVPPPFGVGRRKGMKPRLEKTEVQARMPIQHAMMIRPLSPCKKPTLIFDLI